MAASAADAYADLLPIMQALKAYGSKSIPDLPTGMQMRAEPQQNNAIITVLLGCDDTVKEADKPTKDAVVAALRKLAGSTATDGVTIEPIAKYPNATSCLR